MFSLKDPINIFVVNICVVFVEANGEMQRILKIFVCIIKMNAITKQTNTIEGMIRRSHQFQKLVQLLNELLGRSKLKCKGSKQNFVFIF